jgi:hypothetical protein
MTVPRGTTQQQHSIVPRGTRMWKCGRILWATFVSRETTIAK